MTNNGNNQSVTARDITGSSIVTGNQNTVSTTTTHAAPPASGSVDMKTELAALRQLLAELKNVPDQGKLDRAMQDATEEAAKPKPEPAEISQAVERAVKYAKSADDFGDHVEKLLPRLTAIASWAGVAGRGLLALAGVPT